MEIIDTCQSRQGWPYYSGFTLPAFLVTSYSIASPRSSVSLSLAAVREANGILVVSADHGNSDDMYECDYKTGETIYDEKTGEPKPRTAHSLNPVFAYVYEPTGKVKMRLSEIKDLGISSLAATCLTLLGYEPPEDYTPSIVEIN